MEKFLFKGFKIFNGKEFIKDDCLLVEEGKIAKIGTGLECADAEVVDGDEVVTSYISDKFLPGLLIGYITDVSSDSSMLTQSAHLTPQVDFENITNVLVITQLKSDLLSDDDARSAGETTEGTEETAVKGEGE